MSAQHLNLFSQNPKQGAFEPLGAAHSLHSFFNEVMPEISKLIEEYAAKCGVVDRHQMDCRKIGDEWFITLPRESDGPLEILSLRLNGDATQLDAELSCKRRADASSITVTGRRRLYGSPMVAL